MNTPTARGPEAATLRVLQWLSLASLALAIAAIVMDLPGGRLAAPWLMVIAVGAYIAYAVIDIRRRRRLKNEQRQRETA